MKKLILASSSPRRVELMGILGVPFETCPSGADEALPANTPPAQAVEILAARKCDEVFSRHEDALVIGADTLVSIDGQVLGKPAGTEDARRMLRLLSGRTHMVYTGVALRSAGGKSVFCACTNVEFYPLSDEFIEWYLGTGEPFDKAGAYGIQGRFAVYVERIEGDYQNVVGLPLAKLYRCLKGYREELQ